MSKTLPTCPECGTSGWTYLDAGNDKARLVCEADHPMPPARPGDEDEPTAELVRIVSRIEHKHGHTAARVLMHVFDAIFIQNALSADEGARLLRLTGGGEWDAAGTRLAELGIDWQGTTPFAE